MDVDHHPAEDDIATAADADIDAMNDDDTAAMDDAARAYLAITSHLDQWGGGTPSSSTAAGGAAAAGGYYDDDAMEYEDYGASLGAYGEGEDKAEEEEAEEGEEDEGAFKSPSDWKSPPAAYSASPYSAPGRASSVGLKSPPSSASAAAGGTTAAGAGGAAAPTPGSTTSGLRRSEPVQTPAAAAGGGLGGLGRRSTSAPASGTPAGRGPDIMMHDDAFEEEEEGGGELEGLEEDEDSPVEAYADVQGVGGGGGGRGAQEGGGKEVEDYYNFGTDVPYRPYHSAVLRYLQVRSRLDEKAALLDEEEATTLAGGWKASAKGVAKGREEVQEGLLEAELELLDGLRGAAWDRRTMALDSAEDDDADVIAGANSADAAGEASVKEAARDESNLWSLLRHLRPLGLSSLLYDSSPQFHAAQRDATTRRIYECARRGVEWTPAEVLDVVLHGEDDDGNNNEGNEGGSDGGEEGGGDEVPLMVSRRLAVLKWIESVHGQLIDPASANSRVLGERAGLNAAIGHLSGDAAAAASASPSFGGFGGGGGGFGGGQFGGFNSGGGPAVPSAAAGASADDPSDLALLQAVLSRLKAGPKPFASALDLCRTSGQPWRASSLAGGEPYGRAVERRDDENNSEGGEDTVVEFGNPTRALWKRTAWRMSRALSSSASSSNNTNSNSNTSIGGSSGNKGTGEVPILESAIYSLLSDDVESSLANPALRTWEDGVLVYVRGLVGRLVDEILAAHDDARRGGGKRFPYVGTGVGSGGGQAEREQLASTANLTSLNEGGMFRALERSPFAGVRDEASEPMRRAVSAFVGGGAGGVATFVRELARSVVGVGGDGGDDGDGDGEESSTMLLRFAAHLILYLDLTAPDFLSTLGTLEEAADTDDGELSVREAVLLGYVDHLTSDRGLWHLAALYASFLPRIMLVGTFSKFLTGVNDDGFRRLVLRQSREYFEPGLDLVILRRVVRAIVFDRTDEMEEDRAGYPFVDLLRGADEKRGRRKTNRRAERLDAMLTADDVRKMHSVRWLCYVPEHRPDALICSNALLRRFLLRSNTADVADGGEETDPALHGARVFLSRFVPRDTVDVAVGYGVGRREEEEGEGEDDQSSSSSTVKMPTYDEIQDAAAEHGALQAYVDARVAYDRWTDVLAGTSPIHGGNGVGVRRGGGGRHGAATTAGGRDAAAAPAPAPADGGGIADQMERRSFLHRKKRAGRAVVEAAGDAQEKLMAVLTYGGGWLLPSSQPSSQDDDGGAAAAEDSSAIDAEERATRADEMDSLRRSCLPYAAFLLHAVLDGTAGWMEEFVEDAVGSYGEEEGLRMLSRLVPAAVAGEGEREGGAAAEAPGGDGEGGGGELGRSCPLLPEFWHRSGLALADTVASDEYGLHGTFAREDMGRFLGLLAESSVSLLRCTQLEK